MTIKTPATAGQTIFCIDHGEICEFFIEAIIIVIGIDCIKCDFFGKLDGKVDHICTDSDFGETIFLTRGGCKII